VDQLRSQRSNPTRRFPASFLDRSNASSKSRLPAGLCALRVLIAAGGIAATVAFQRFGVRSALIYVLSGSIVWIGLHHAGVQPVLFGSAVAGLSAFVLGRFVLFSNREIRKAESEA